MNAIEAALPRPGRRNYLVVLMLVAAAAVVALHVATMPAAAQSPFDVSVAADIDVNGSGSNIDTIAFWEAPSPTDSLMFVTSKNVSLVEVWRYPFTSAQPVLTDSCIDNGTNGVIVDQAADLLYVSVTQSRNVCVFSLPDLALVQTINSDSAYGGEPNLGLLHLANGQTRLYVSDDNVVYIHDTTNGIQLDKFNPSRGLETLVGDDLNQTIYIPDENGGSGVYIYDPNGNSAGATFGGGGIFDADEEGIIVYTCPSSGSGDSGDGFIVVSDQLNPVNDYEFFDRQNKAYLGKLHIGGANNTDGIASTQQASPAYPLGLFAAIDDDTSTVGVGWDKVLAAAGLSCPGDSGPPPTATNTPPTATTIPPTATSEAPTATPETGATSTPEPTATSLPPAQPPSDGRQPAPVSPVGDTVSQSPTYQWQGVADAEWYWLWVQDSASSTILQQPINAATCSDGTCSAAPVEGICDGEYNWWVIAYSAAWEASGYGPWSSPQGFSVTSSRPCRPTLTAPVASVASGAITFSWTGTGDAAWYFLLVQSEDGAIISGEWHSAASECVSVECGHSLTMGTGSYRWWVKAWNASGEGPWSNPYAGQSFQIVEP